MYICALRLDKEDDSTISIKLNLASHTRFSNNEHDKA